MRKTPLFAPFIYKMHHIAKIGSGQTYEKLRKEAFFAGHDAKGFPQFDGAQENGTAAAPSGR